MKKLAMGLSLALCQLTVSAQTIEVNFSGSTANVTVPAGISNVAVTRNGAHVTLNSTTTDTEYTYHVTGSTTNGSLTINGAYKLTLELDGVNIKSAQGAAIDVENGKRVAVVLTEGTESTLEDCSGGGQKAAMYFSGHPEFEGAGILNVKGNTGHAISAKEYLQIKKTAGTINVLGAVKDGLHCGKGKVSAWDETMTLNENEFFFCNGGVVNISNVGSDCIDAGDYGCMYIKGGTLNLTTSALDACGLKCVNTLIMEDGQVNIDLDGNLCDGIYVNNEARLQGGAIEVYNTGNGSKGIKAKLKATTPYTSGGNVTISGTDISMIVAGADDASEDPADPSHCVGISVDGNLTQTDGLVKIITVGDEARGVTCDGTMNGTFDVQARKWYVNPFDYQYSMSLYAVLPEANYAECEIAAFVGGECRGTLEYNADGYGYIRLYSNTSAGETFSFKAYDAAADKYVGLTNTLSFVSDGTAGSPLSPIVLEKDAASTTIAITDGTMPGNEGEKTYGRLTYTRNFRNTAWQPLFVPFSMTYADWADLGLEVARINGFYEYDDDENGTIDRSALEVLKVKTGRLIPNHPYLVRSKNVAMVTITLDNATLTVPVESSINCSTVETRYTFTGTYNSISMSALNAQDAYIMSSGTLRQAGSALNPMRWYMTRESRGGQLLPDMAEIKVFVKGENEADAINLVGEDAEEQGQAYNLMGQKVTGDVKGIVIKNGRKVVK